MLDAAMPQKIGVTMPYRSANFPISTPPNANPTIVRVNGKDASARATANSACTAGSTTGTDHMPTLPIQPSPTAAISRRHAYEDSSSEVGASGLGILLLD